MHCGSIQKKELPVPFQNKNCGSERIKLRHKPIHRNYAPQYKINNTMDGYWSKIFLYRPMWLLLSGHHIERIVANDLLCGSM